MLVFLLSTSTKQGFFFVNVWFLLNDHAKLQHPIVIHNTDTRSPFYNVTMQ